MFFIKKLQDNPQQELLPQAVVSSRNNWGEGYFLTSLADQASTIFLVAETEPAPCT